MLDINTLPYVGAKYQRARSAAITLIVLHSGETTEGDTAAEGMASYFASGATTGSAHICVDNNSGVRCAPDSNRTNGAGDVNEFSLHLEQAGRAGQSFVEWTDPYSNAVVANAADVVRQWCDRHGVPKRFLWAADLAAGNRHGITVHAEVSKVFAHNDGHWDPGPAYPITTFMELVGGGGSSGTKRGARMHSIVLDRNLDGVTFTAHLCFQGAIIATWKGNPGAFGIPRDALQFMDKYQASNGFPIERIEHSDAVVGKIKKLSAANGIPVS